LILRVVEQIPFGSVVTVLVIPPPSNSEYACPSIISKLISLFPKNTGVGVGSLPVDGYAIESVALIV